MKLIPRDGFSPLDMQELCSYLQISYAESAQEGIASSRTRAILFKSSELPPDFQKNHGQDFFADKPRRFIWRAKRILTDSPCEGADLWSTRDDLLLRLRSLKEPAYVICAANVADFVKTIEAIELLQSITPIILYDAQVIIGPTLLPGCHPCPKCYSRRLRANLPAFGQRVLRGHRLVPPSDGDVTAAIRIAIKLWETPFANRGQDCALVVDLHAAEMRRESLAPHPDCNCFVSPHSYVFENDYLRGRIFGAIRDVGSPAAQFPPFGIVTAKSAEFGELMLGGSCGLNHDELTYRASAEAAERFALHIAPESRFRVATARELRVSDIVRFHPFKPSQYQEADFPYQPLTESVPTSWIKGVNQIDGSASWIPARLISLAPFPIDVAFAPQSSTGAAAGLSVADASERAILELAERDIATRCWYERKLLRLATDDFAPGEKQFASNNGFSLELFLCPNHIKLPVVLAYLKDINGKGSLGLSAGLSLPRAVSHAIEESVQMLIRFQGKGGLPDLPLLDDVVDAPLADPWRHHGATIRSLIEHYRPISVNLTNPTTRSCGLFVVSMWSEFACDFISDSREIPTMRWDPAAAVVARVEREYVLFQG